MTISLHPVRDADEAFMRHVFASTRQPELALLPEGAATAFVESQYELQRTHYRSHFPNATNSVIEAAGRPVGRMIVDRSSRPWLLVDIAFVEGERGRGLGTGLLRELIDEAERAGTGIGLSVRADNYAARRLYERLGFTTVGGDGVYLTLSTTQAEGQVA